MSIFNYLDFYGKTINLHLFGREKYKTKIGSFFGLATLMLTMTIIYFFLYDMFSRNIMTIIFNQDESTLPVVNLTNIPIMFTMADLSGNIIRPERLYTFDLKKANLVIDKIGNGVSYPRTEWTTMPVEVCEKEKHIPKEYYQFFESMTLSNYYCMKDFSNLNLTLYGVYGDFLKGFSTIQLYLKRCENSTLNNNSCYSDLIIDKKLTNVYFNFAFLSYQINHYNTTQSRQMKLQTISSEITTTLLKRFRYYLNQVLYNTDNGLFFEDNFQENYFRYDSFQLDVDTRNSGIITSTSNFVNFSFRCSDHVYFYKRSYIKLQTFLANVGGIFKAIMLISEIIVTIITRNFYLLDIINSIFFLGNDKKSEDNEEKEIRMQNSEFNMIVNDKANLNNLIRNASLKFENFKCDKNKNIKNENNVKNIKNKIMRNTTKN